MSSEYSQSNQGGFQEIILMPMLVALVVWATWYLARVPLLFYSFKLSYYMFEFYNEYFSFLFFAGELAELRGAIQDIPSVDPTKHGFVSLMKLWKLHGYVGRWVFIPLMLYWAVRTKKGVVRFKYRRKLKNVYELMDVQSEFFVASAIVKNKNLLQYDIFDGPWAYSALPLDFALDNQILWCNKDHSKIPTSEGKQVKLDFTKMTPIPPFKAKDKSEPLNIRRSLLPHYDYVAFNVEKARDTYVAQLGKPWAGIQSLSPFELALFSILASRIAEDHKASVAMIDQIGFSWREATYDKNWQIVKPHTANMSGVRELAEKYANHKDVLRITEMHHYTYNVFYSMLTKARTKGRLYHAHLLWIRPIDPRLWRVICTEGGQCSYQEVAGVHSHHLMELKIGRKLSQPFVLSAVYDLYKTMQREHWIDPAEFSEKAQQELVSRAQETLAEGQREADMLSRMSAQEKKAQARRRGAN